MLESTFPQWVREQCLAFISGYEEAATACVDRCDELKKAKGSDRTRVPADKLGTYDDYRLDATYYHGQAERLRQYLIELGPATGVDDSRETPYGEQAIDPTRLSQVIGKPWSSLMGGGLPEPEEALRILRPNDLMERFTEREAEALILVYGLGMKVSEAAAIMGCKPRKVSAYLLSARHKFTPNEGYRDE